MAMRVDKTKPTQTIAGTTGQQMAPVGLLGEPMAKTIGDAGLEVGAALSEADQRIVKRNDAIKSITANDDFNRKINDEYNSLSETSDMKDPEVLRKFNSFVRREQALALNNFAGTSQEAKSRFEEAILIGKGLFDDIGTINGLIVGGASGDNVSEDTDSGISQSDIDSLFDQLCPQQSFCDVFNTQTLDQTAL